jgi:hypothetical protein
VPFHLSPTGWPTRPNLRLAEGQSVQGHVRVWIAAVVGRVAPAVGRMVFGANGTAKNVSKHVINKGTPA